MVTSFWEEREQIGENPVGLPGLNLAQVCILFFLPSSRQLNLSANRKTKENVFSKAHGNSAPQAPQTLKCFHSVLSGVLYQSQIMRDTVVPSRGHSHEYFHLPALSWGYRTGTSQEMLYSPVCREILDYQSVFFLTCVFSGVSLCPGTSLPLFYCSSFPTMEDVSVSLTQLSDFAASANIY